MDTRAICLSLLFFTFPRRSKKKITLPSPSRPPTCNNPLAGHEKMTALVNLKTNTRTGKEWRFVGESPNIFFGPMALGAGQWIALDPVETDKISISLAGFHASPRFSEFDLYE